MGRDAWDRDPQLQSLAKQNLLPAVEPSFRQNLRVERFTNRVSCHGERIKNTMLGQAQPQRGVEIPLSIAAKDFLVASESFFA